MSDENFTTPSQISETGGNETQKYGGVIAWMADNAVASNLLMLVLILGGLVFLGRIKQEVFPSFDLDQVIINVPYPGASPAEVEQGVILAAEEAVRGLDGIKEVRSTASEGTGVVAIELLLGTDPNKALADIKSAVDRITSFPEEIERPVVSLATIRQRVIDVVISGNVPIESLRDLADRTRSELLSRDDVTYAELVGARAREISVNIPQDQLRAYGLTLTDVAQAISQSSVEIPAGSVKTEGGQVLLRVAERAEEGADFADIVLRSMPNGTQLRVRDIAQVEDGFAETDEEMLFDGKPARIVRVYRVGDETPIGIASAVKEYIEKNKDRFGDDVSVTTWDDRSKMYRQRIDLLVRNALLGLVLVLLTLGLFLELRLAFWVTMGIPISFIGSLLFLPSLDVSVNMISLFAFIVTLGMVVDDAIIVGEAIYSHIQEGHSRMRAAILGAKEVARPVILSILTTCVFFAPMLFVPGVTGKFFRVIPIVVILVLMMSLVESLLVLPAHLGHKNRFLRFFLLALIGWPAALLLILPALPVELVQTLLRVPKEKRLARRAGRKVGEGLAEVEALLARFAAAIESRFARRLERFIEHQYRPFLELAYRNRYVTLALAAAVFFVAVGWARGGHIDFTFMPKTEGDWVIASIEMPYGTDIEETRSALEQVDAALDETLKHFGSAADLSEGRLTQLGNNSRPGGGHRGDSGGGAATHTAMAWITLVDSGARKFTSGEFAKVWRERIGDIPGIENLKFSFAIGASSDTPIDFRLSHPDAGILEEAATALADRIREFDGVMDVQDGYEEGKPQLDIKLRPEGRAAGLTQMDVARQLRAAFYGAEAIRQQRGRDEIRVYVRRPREERSSVAEIENLILRTPDGGEMALSAAADAEYTSSYTNIERTDGRRNLNVTADVVPGVGNTQRVMQTTWSKHVPELKSEFPGLVVEPGGERRSQQDTFASLAQNGSVALLVMFALLAIAFRSYIQPIIVILGAVPFGFVGALIGHIIMGYDLSMISILGIVALCGVVVNDSLILVVAVNDYLDRHNHQSDAASIREAVIFGGTRRFRPILLTSLTTFFGLMPMILETSVQARFLIPMALSLGFGVLFATVVLLLVVPSAYGAVEDLKRFFGRSFGRAEAATGKLSAELTSS